MQPKDILDTSNPPRQNTDHDKEIIKKMTDLIVDKLKYYEKKYPTVYNSGYDEWIERAKNIIIKFSSDIDKVK